MNYESAFIDRPNLGEKNKALLLAKQQLHLKNAEEARGHMKEIIDQCKALITRDMELKQSLPLSGPELAHYSFDFAQEVSNVIQERIATKHFECAALHQTYLVLVLNASTGALSIQSNAARAYILQSPQKMRYIWGGL